MSFPPGFSPKASLFHGAFCGAPLDRTTGKEHKDPKWEEAALQNEATRFLLFSTHKGTVGAAPVLLKERPLPTCIAWQTLESLSGMGIEPVGHCCNGVPPILLGAKDGVQHFALLQDLPVADVEAKAICPEGKKVFVAEGMSQLMKVGCDEGDFTIIGHAFAKIVWHKSSLYCGASGEKNASIECGAKRACKASKTRTYARTDPSCMVLVRNADDSKCLLISGQDKSNPHMWTCISGFVEQCEQVEECAKREVWEEAGVEVDLSKGVDWLGSQPWPLGVGGKCELMLAMEMVAASEDVAPNLNEVKDARWHTREEVQRMLTTPPNQDGKPFVPPFISQAHFLLQRWVKRSSSPSESAPSMARDKLQSAFIFFAGFGLALASSWALRARRR